MTELRAGIGETSVVTHEPVTALQEARGAVQIRQIAESARHGVGYGVRVILTSTSCRRLINSAMLADSPDVGAQRRQSAPTRCRLDPEAR